MIRLSQQIMAATKEAFPVKKITKKQSRKNIKKRKAKVAARHATAGRWTKRPQPMFAAGGKGVRAPGNSQQFFFVFFETRRPPVPLRRFFIRRQRVSLRSAKRGVIH
jgi:hypothetical protein